MKNASASKTLQECNKDCKSPTPAPTPPPTPSPHYRCNWDTFKCVSDPIFPPQTLPECNETCQPAKYAACNTTTGKCDQCPFDPKTCNTELTVCSTKCKKSNNTKIAGTWRGIEISEGFARGEWDFTFFKEGVMKIGYGGAEAKERMVWGLQADDARAFNGGRADGAPIAFTFTKVPATSGADPLKAKVGDKLSGIFATSAGSYSITKYMYFAFGEPGKPPALGFDDGLTKLSFNMVSCLHTKHCDFDPAAVPEEMRIVY